ncbi:uncharacterized protein LOC143701497 [Siphateles boraxobius]|uniref:uncharacterized protein LOC143701497 n=1 Tax=Siphateles boraxobius TaxID=180520 RepID=UPI0040646007
MNLSSGTRTRPVRFGGFTLALVLLSTCACTDCAERNVTVQAGEPAVLPCTCPPDQPPFVVWQTTVRDQLLVVSDYRGEDNKEDKQADEYRDRTELKLTENCSLTLLNVTPSDEGTYTCYYQIGPVRQDIIYLQVTERPAPPERIWDVQKTVLTSSVCGILVLVFITVAVVVYVGISRRNRRQMNGTFTPTLKGII